MEIRVALNTLLKIFVPLTSVLVDSWKGILSFRPIKATLLGSQNPPPPTPPPCLAQPV